MDILKLYAVLHFGAIYRNAERSFEVSNSIDERLSAIGIERKLDAIVRESDCGTPGGGLDWRGHPRTAGFASPWLQDRLVPARARDVFAS